MIVVTSSSLTLLLTSLILCSYPVRNGLNNSVQLGQFSSSSKEKIVLNDGTLACTSFAFSNNSLVLTNKYLTSDSIRICSISLVLVFGYKGTNTAPVNCTAKSVITHSGLPALIKPILSRPSTVPSPVEM